MHIGNEIGDSVLFGDDDADFFIVSLASVQLATKSGDMDIWSVAPGRTQTLN